MIGVATLSSKSGTSRWKAAGIHLGISLSIGLVLAILLRFVWYPPPYFHASGADELVLLLVGVDLVLGPLLTLVVFRSGKWGLYFDLAVIGLAQAAAFVYGVSVVLASRPVFLVATVDRFVVVTAGEVSDSDLRQGMVPQFRQRSFTGPRLVFALYPDDPSAQALLVTEAMSGKDLQNQPRYFRDYATYGTAMLRRGHPVEALAPGGADRVAAIDQWLASRHLRREDVVWLPVRALKEDLVIVLDARTARPLALLPIQPLWGPSNNAPHRSANGIEPPPAQCGTAAGC